MSIRNAVFSSERLSSIALGYCTPKTLACLSATSKAFKQLAIATVNSQLAVSTTIHLNVLQEYRHFLKANSLSLVLDQMPKIRRLILSGDIFGKTTKDVNEIFQSSRCTNWTTIELHYINPLVIKEMLPLIAARCTSLQTLSINYETLFRDSVLDFIEACKSMKLLQLQGTFDLHLQDRAMQLNPNLEIKQKKITISQSMNDPKAAFFNNSKFKKILSDFCDAKDIARLHQTCSAFKAALPISPKLHRESSYSDDDAPFQYLVFSAFVSLS